MKTKSLIDDNWSHVMDEITVQILDTVSKTGNRSRKPKQINKYKKFKLRHHSKHQSFANRHSYIHIPLIFLHTPNAVKQKQKQQKSTKDQ